MTWHLHKFSKNFTKLKHLWQHLQHLCCLSYVLWVNDMLDGEPLAQSVLLRTKDLFFCGVTFTPLSIQHLKFQHTAINNTPAAWSCRYYASLLGWLLSVNEYWLTSSELNIYTWTLIKPETLLLFCVCYGPYVPEEHENTGRAPKYVTVCMSRNYSNYAKHMESSWLSIHPFIHPSSLPAMKMPIRFRPLLSPCSPGHYLANKNWINK